MTHLPFIVVSYGLAAAIGITLGVGAAIRLRHAHTRLATLESGKRERRGGARAGVDTSAS